MEKNYETCTITNLGFVKSYGFRDGGYIEVTNLKKKEPKSYRFYDRSAWVEEYCKKCGINEEVNMGELVGRRVTLTFGTDDDGNEILWLSLPKKFWKRSSDQYIISTLA